MHQHEELLDENSIEDLIDEDTNPQEEDSDNEKNLNQASSLDDKAEKEKKDEEEEILGAESEFGEDPDYDDSVDDFDVDN